MLTYRQSEEDLQLKAELEMLVERLKVSLEDSRLLIARNPTPISTSLLWNHFEP